MSKPTLSIGGTLHPNELRQLARLLIDTGWLPPIAAEEGDDDPKHITSLRDGETTSQSYMDEMKDAASYGMPFVIGSFERNENLLYEIARHGIEAWLTARKDRLAWRVWRPAGRDEDGCLYNGSIKVAGLGAPDCARNVRCPIDSEGDPFVHLVDRDERNWVLEARENLAIFDFHPPALVIKG